MDKSRRMAALPTSKDDFAVIGNPLRSNGQGNILGAADEILDLERGKFQSEINGEVEKLSEDMAGINAVGSLQIEVETSFKSIDEISISAWKEIPDFTLTDEQVQTVMKAATEGKLLRIIDKSMDISGIYYSVNYQVNDKFKSDTNPLGVYYARFDGLSMMSYYSAYGAGWNSIEICMEGFTNSSGTHYAKGRVDYCIKPTYIGNWGNLPTRVIAGAMTWHNATKQAAVYDGKKWLATDGQADYLRRGATAQRPAELTAGDAGFTFYDTTLKKPIYWNGEAWTDSQGNVL